MKSSSFSGIKALHSLFVRMLLIFATAAVSAVEPKLPPGSGGDTTADLVLGQLDFVHNGKNFIDGRGLDSAPDIVGDVAIDKSVIPNRVYVVDRRNHRVLGWNSILAFGTHAAANIVIGQPDFLSGVCNNGRVSASAASLCNPTGVAVDRTGNLFVADTTNQRVLYYQKPFAKGVEAGIAADDVFGQFGSFTTSSCNGFGTSQDTLCNPVRVALDAAGNLYVADQSNHRVLGYRTPEQITVVVGSGDTTADLVFGQFGGFNTSTCNNAGISANSLCTPAGLTVDASNNLYVADFTNNRVLKFNAPLTTNTTADKVYGQLNVFTTQICNNGGVNNQSLCNPVSVAVDPAGAVYIADRSNHRVLAYPATGSTAANKVLGQFGSFNTNLCNNTGGGSFPPVNSKSLCNPDGIALDRATAPNSPKVYVSDSSNNRVLQYTPTGAPATIKNGQGAGGVLGQLFLTTKFADFLDGKGFATSEFNEGAVAIDRSVVPNRIYVSDPPNNRVLAWNTVAAFTTHAPATLVFGQPSVFTNTANNGGISRTSLNRPRAIAVDSAGNLYVADQSNHRVLVFNTPFASGTVADRVFGQAGIFTTGGCNQPGLNAGSLCTPAGLALDSAGNLYVGDFTNNRVLKYNVPLTNIIADKVYGQAGIFTSNTCNLGGVTANSLCGPHGVAVDAADNLYVADHLNNRVLEFNKLPATNTTADFVFGQASKFTTNTCNIGALTADSLCRPRFVTTNTTGNVVFIADTDNNRVLKYNAPLTTNRTADRVFGQGNLFTANGCKTLSPNTLCIPDGIAVDGANNLYIVDSNNNRVLEFLKP